MESGERGRALGTEDRGNRKYSEAWLLRRVSVPDAFFFFRDPESYTGRYAVSLDDLCEKFGLVPVESVEFHFRRSDIEKWIGRIIGDRSLAEMLAAVDRSLRGEELRAAVTMIIQGRLGELRRKL